MIENLCWSSSQETKCIAWGGSRHVAVSIMNLGPGLLEEHRPQLIATDVVAKGRLAPTVDGEVIVDKNRRLLAIHKEVHSIHT